MDTSQTYTNENTPPAVAVGRLIRDARKKGGWSIAQLAEKIGRPREWLNRVELGYSQYGEHKPPSQADLSSLIELLDGYLDASKEEILAFGIDAEKNFDSLRRGTRTRVRKAAGKLIQTEIIMGEVQVAEAIVGLINEQHSDAVIRNTGIKGLGSYVKVTDEWKKYREALGEFLTKNPNSVFKRVEYAANSQQLELAKQADVRLAGTRDLEDVHNARIKFHKHNPLLLHVLIGQREAILALPQTSGQAGSSMAILVRDKLFVEALRVWYDEVLWEGAGPSQMLQFTNFDDSFEEVKAMYGFEE